MTVVKENAAKILQKYLQDHGIKQSFVASKIGMSESSFSSRLNGRLKFSAEFAIAVSKALNIKADIFLNLN